MTFEEFSQIYEAYNELDRIAYEAEAKVLEVISTILDQFRDKHKVEWNGYDLTRSNLVATFKGDYTFDIETIFEDLNNNYPKGAIFAWLDYKFSSFLSGNADRITLKQYITDCTHG